MAEVDSIRQALSRWTSVSFRRAEPGPKSPAASQKIKWFLASPYREGSSGAFHANEVWESVNGDVHIESTAVGNTLLWVESDYGKSGIEEVMKMDLSKFSDVETRRKFCAHFPAVGKRLDQYEKFLEQASSRWKTDLSIRYSGEKRFAAIFIHAKLTAAGQDLRSKINWIKMTTEALDDVLNAIREYETREIGEGRGS